MIHSHTVFPTSKSPTAVALLTLALLSLANPCLAQSAAWMRVGYSQAADPVAASRAAAQQAAQDLNPKHIALVVVLESLPAVGQDVIDGLRSVVGPDAPIVGCSTFGQITRFGVDARSDQDDANPSIAVAILTQSADHPVNVQLQYLPTADTSQAAQAIAALAPSTQTPASAVTLLFVAPSLVYSDDGLDLPIALAGAQQRAGRSLPVFGGIAGNANKPDKTALIYTGSGAAPRGLVAVVLTGELDVHDEVRHALIALGPTFTVTKNAGRRVLQLDGQPAAQVVTPLFESLFPDERVQHMGILVANRAINMGFSIGDDQSLIFSRQVPTGAQMRVQGGDTPYMDPFATDQQAVAAIAAKKPQAAWIFNCVGRQPKTAEAAEATRQMLAALLPKTPVIGFYSGGEIGPIPADDGSPINEFHHTTVVVVGLSTQKQNLAP